MNENENGKFKNYLEMKTLFHFFSLQNVSFSKLSF